MATNNHLKEIIQALSRAGVAFIVCGGVAVVLHGVERMTLDLDISLRMEEANIQTFLEVMQQSGLVPRTPVSSELLLDPDKVSWMVKEKNALVFTFIDLENPYRQVDVFLTSKNSYESLAPHTVNIELDGQRFLMVSREKLIEMKREVNPMRTKDLSDIQALLQLEKS